MQVLFYRDGDLGGATLFVFDDGFEALWLLDEFFHDNGYAVVAVFKAHQLRMSHRHLNTLALAFRR